MKKDIGETLTGRRESLDVLRGLAAVLIFVFHFFALYPSGQIPTFEKLNYVVLNYFAMGVPLFYSLSGVSLYIGYFKKHRNQGFVRDFYISRIFRILPLFYVATLAWFLIFYSRGVTPAYNDIATTLSFLFNLMPGYHESLVAAGWSVGVEMLFYLIFPLIIARVVSLFSSLVLLVGMCVVSICSHKFLIANFPSSNYPDLSIFTHMHFFAGGVAVYCLADRWLYIQSRFGKFIEYISIIAICGVVISVGALTSNSISETLLGRDSSIVRVLWVIPIMFLLFYACTVQPSQPWLKPFVKLGEWSFSLYLMHPIVLYFLFEPLRRNQLLESPTAQAFFMRLGIGLIVLIICSAVTYHWIEKQGIKLGRFTAKLFS
jgi:peptidoglycan/LPS O-acetylase OafA/YrhL